MRYFVQTPWHAATYKDLDDLRESVAAGWVAESWPARPESESRWYEVGDVLAGDRSRPFDQAATPGQNPYPFRKANATLLGNVLVCFGVGLVMLGTWTPLFFWFVMYFVMNFIENTSLTQAGSDAGAMFLQEGSPLALAAYAATVLGGPGCLYVGVRLKRGRYKMVLFLRRFGYRKATRTLSSAVAGAVGSRFRIITLDDNEVSPLGVGRRTRRLWRVSKWTAFAAVALLAGALFYLDAVKEPSSLADRLPEEVTQNPLIGLLIAPVLLLLVTQLAMVVAVPCSIALGGVLVAYLLSWRADAAVRRAEAARQLEVRDPLKVERSIGSLLRRNRRVFAPRMVVVRCDNSVWRDVVSRLLIVARGVIIDVSRPSANVLWEMNAAEVLRARVVFVCQHDAVKGVLTGAPVADCAQSVTRQLAERLRDREVLRYASEAGPLARLFEAALAERLGHTTR